MANLITPEDLVPRLMEAFASTPVETPVETPYQLSNDPLNDFIDLDRTNALRNVYAQANQSGIPFRPMDTDTYRKALIFGNRTTDLAPTVPTANDLAALGSNVVLEAGRIPSTALSGLMALGGGTLGAMADLGSGRLPGLEGSETRKWFNSAAEGAQKYLPQFSMKRMLSTENPFYAYDRDTDTYGAPNWGNIIEAGVDLAAPIVGGALAKPAAGLTVNTAEKALARQAAFEEAAQAASKRGTLAEIPYRPQQTFSQVMKERYAPVDYTNPATWSGRPNIITSADDVVAQAYKDLDRLATSPTYKIIGSDADRVLANEILSVDKALPTPNLGRFSPWELYDNAIKMSLDNPLKLATAQMGAQGMGEGVEQLISQLDPTSPANVAAREEAQLAEEVANRINASQTAQPNTESAGGAQPSSQPDLSFSYPSPLLPTDPTQITLFTDKVERPREFNTVAKMDNATLRDWYLKQTGGALDLGPVFEALRDLPEYFSRHEAAKIALTEAANKAGIEANDSWLSTIGWLITIPFAIRRGMSPDELWEKIVNSRIALNPQVRQAQAALENIEALRNARLDLLSKVSPLIAYAIQGTSNPELAEARTILALANAQKANEQAALTKEQTRKTQQGNDLRENVLGQGNSRWVDQSANRTATSTLKNKSNK